MLHHDILDAYFVYAMLLARIVVFCDDRNDQNSLNITDGSVRPH
jgi:hypothetical protein